MTNFSLIFLVAALVSNVLFGIFINIAVVCSRIFYHKIKEHQVNYAHLGSFIVITLLCCAKVILDNVLVVQAFSDISDGEATYPTFGSPPTMTLNVLWVMETLVADAFVAYRLWIVYRKSLLVIIAPCIILLGCLAAGIIDLYLISTYNGDETQLLAVLERVNAASTAFVSTTLALNVLCTGMISYRIWRVRSDVTTAVGARSTGQDVHRDPVKRVITIVIESAAIYTLVLLLYIALIAAGSDGAYIIVPIISPIIALVFGSIIVRSARGVAVGQTASADYKNPSTNTGVYELRTGRGPRDERMSRNPAGALQVQLSTVVTSRVDGKESESVPCDIRVSSDTKYP